MHVTDDVTTLLSAGERRRAARFVRAEDAVRYRVARGALRAILAERLGVDPHDLAFTTGEYGKPALRDGGPHFNVSHSGALALVAVSDERPVGVDVERVRPIDDASALARSALSESSAATLGTLPSAARHEQFLRRWTAMEAVTKAEGCGLGDDLGRRLEVELAAAGPARATLGGGPSRRWALQWLTPTGGYIGAVAMRGADFTARLRQFRPSSALARHAGPF